MTADVDFRPKRVKSALYGIRRNLSSKARENREISVVH